VTYLDTFPLDDPWLGISNVVVSPEYQEQETIDRLARLR
jgi:hypothetical protein